MTVFVRLIVITLATQVVFSTVLAQQPQQHRAALVTQTGHVNWIAAVTYSLDGRTLASGSEDHTVKLWDASTGTELRTFNGHSDNVSSVAFSPDGKILASGSLDHSIKLWDVESGLELHSLPAPGSVTSVSFSPDGRTLASGSLPMVKLWDIESGRELRSIEVQTKNDLSVAFLPDGRTIAIAAMDHMITLWDVASGREVSPLAGDKETVGLVACTFSPDGRTMAGDGDGGAITLWDVGTGRELRILEGQFAASSIAFSPDGRTLASGSFDSTVTLWDVGSGRKLRTLQGDHETVRSVAFSPDGETLASGSFRRIKLWNLGNGRELRSLEGHTNRDLSIAFSPDGRTLASAGWDLRIKLWDVGGDRELRTFAGHTNPVFSLAFSPDGRTLASGGASGEVKLWNVRNGRLLHTFTGHTSVVSDIVFSPDARTIASGSWDHTIKLWSVGSGRELRTLQGDNETFRVVAFSPDGRMIAGGDDSVIKVWDVGSGRLHNSLTVNDENKEKIRQLVSHFLGSEDYKTVSERFIAQYAENGGINLYDRSTFSDKEPGKELCSLIAFNELDWLVITPDGFFDGTVAAWRQVIWRLDNNTFRHAPVEAFFSDFFRPGLLQDIFYHHIPAADGDISRKDIRQPEVKVGLVDDCLKLDGITSREVFVRVDVVDSPQDDRRPNATSGANDVRLFRNGALVKVWPGDVFDKGGGCQPVPTKKGEQRHAMCQTNMKVLAGKNQLTAYAFNDDNVKSSDGEALVKGAESLRRAGTAYVLAIGINDYSNKDYNLRYAVADAGDFGAEVKRRQGSLKQFKKVEVIPLYDKDATRENILLALKRLSGSHDLPASAPEALKRISEAEPEDAVIIFFAGHGTAKAERFYLLAHDFVAGIEDQREGRTISNIELNEVLEGVGAGKLIMVIDACQSGQALGGEKEGRGPMNSKGLAQLAYDKGMYILTAAQSYQAALEVSRLQSGTEIRHGLLTFALLEGLNKARKDSEGRISERDWMNYAVEQVPLMQLEETKKHRGANKQGSVQRSGKRVKPANNSAAGSVQRPRVFYRRELDTRPLIVAKPQWTKPRSQALQLRKNIRNGFN
jgi:WD40 repeat protein